MPLFRSSHLKEKTLRRQINTIMCINWCQISFSSAITLSSAIGNANGSVLYSKIYKNKTHEKEINKLHRWVQRQKQKIYFLNLICLCFKSNKKKGKHFALLLRTLVSFVVTEVETFDRKIRQTSAPSLLHQRKSTFFSFYYGIRKLFFSVVKTRVKTESSHDSHEFHTYAKFQFTQK